MGHRHFIRLCLVLIPFSASFGSSTVAQAHSPAPSIRASEYHDSSAPLALMVAPPMTSEERQAQVNAPLPIPAGSPLLQGRSFADPARDLGISHGILPELGITFPGHDDNTDPARPSVPDTNGDVGPNHYVQVVNYGLSVYTRDGELLMGAIPASVIFADFDGAQGYCRHNFSDPTIRYDAFADRWLITQLTMPYPGGLIPPFYECIAVSSTPDPLGGYYRYAYGPFMQYDVAAFNDYPKFAIWPDGYYASYNMFLRRPGWPFAGSRLCAYDRDSMLWGSDADEVCFQLFGPGDTLINRGYGGALPSDLDGPFLPPPGSPNFFVADSNVPDGPDGKGPNIELWRFHVDWDDPSQSTLSNNLENCPTELEPPCPELITVEDFQLSCGDSHVEHVHCIPQYDPGGPYRPYLLSSVGDRLMYRAVYRYFPGDDQQPPHESLLLSRTVQVQSGEAGGFVPTGVRWYEMRNQPDSTMAETLPIVYQQSTFAPDDGLWRWMSSIAMDGEGNIAIGYSASSQDAVPSIRFAARLQSSPLGTMDGEGILWEGAGSDYTSYRWGDYSRLAIDPTDDCTFWYTNEYYRDFSPASAWLTRVATFKYPGCQSKSAAHYR